MKKLYFLFLLISLSFNSWSQQLLYEPFDYTSHATLGLYTQSGGLWTVPTGGDSILVTSGSLSYPGLQSSLGNKVTFGGTGSDNFRSFTSQPSTTAATVYSSYILNVTALGTLNTTGGYFAGFTDAGTTSNFGATLWTRASSTTGKYNIGIATRSTASAVSWLPTDFTPGTTYFVVTAYVINVGASNDVAKVWINTSNIGGTEPTADATAVSGSDLGSVGKFALRQDAANATPSIDLDEIRVGTTWASVTPAAVAASPSLSINPTSLSDFGSKCVGGRGGPQSFTITGSNLTSDVSVTIPAGFGYSIGAGPVLIGNPTFTPTNGSLNTSLNIWFLPTAIQAYSGNITISGGGATDITLAVSGTGVAPTPTLTTGAASSITPTSVTLAGNVTTGPCADVTIYGIEYSTNPGFTQGTGTKVAASNQVQGNFSVNLSNLFSSQAYYYRAYATTVDGTTYGSEQTFTTSAGTVILSATTLTDFGTLCLNDSSAVQSFTLSGVEARSGTISNVPKPGYYLSLSPNGPFNSTLLLFPTTAGNFSQVIYVKFKPTLAGSYNTNLQFYGAGTAANFMLDVPVTGEGVNAVPRLTTDGVSSILSNSALAAGTITSEMCSAVTVYGFEFSTDQTFATGVTQVVATNISNNSFTASLAGLQPSTVYYVRSFATNNGGTGYGGQLSFTTANSAPLLTVTPPPAFGPKCISFSYIDSFTVSGSNLTTADVSVNGIAGYTFASSLNGTYSSTLVLQQGGGNYSKKVYVKFAPTAATTYIGFATVSGGGAAASPVFELNGAGINDAPMVTTGVASNVGSTSAAAAGTIDGNGCSVISAYGIEYSTTANFVGGTGTKVASSNFLNQIYSSSLTGLTPATTYYFRSYATNNGGTTYGAIQSFTTLTPSITASTLADFGSLCLNTTSSTANSFTITGTNLTGANVTVSSLAGYTFATTAGGVYANSLSLSQTGGAFSQTVFVKFTPTAVQSYNGNIVVSGGGATNVTVAATGSGINTTATVATGTASGITASAATLAGTISNTGCSAVTAYGIEYSTTNNFANGTGTKVTSANISGTAYTAALTGLTANTTYYYKAYATNSGGTVYGTQQSFATLAPPPASITVSTVASFGSACLNTTPAAASFTITGVNLTAAPVTVGALAGYTYSTTANGTYTATLSLPQTGGAFSQQVFVKFTPTAAQAYNGNIAVGGGGATTANVAVTGTGVNTAPTVATGASTNVTTGGATLAGSVTAAGCSAVTGYGIEYSGVNGFAGGSGIKVAGSNMAANAFTVPVAGLVQGTTYYYRAYATNAGGTAYSPQQTLVIPAIADGTKIYPVPLKAGQLLTFSQNKLAPGFYAIQLLNSMGQEVYRKNLSIQVDFINEKLSLPASLPSGIYKIRLLSNTETIVTETIELF